MGISGPLSPPGQPAIRPLLLSSSLLGQTFVRRTCGGDREGRPKAAAATGGGGGEEVVVGIFILRCLRFFFTVFLGSRAVSDRLRA